MPGPLITAGRKKALACGMILSTEVLERVAFYAFLGGLVIFLNGEPTKWTEINALNLTFVFIGISCSSALVGSVLADVCFGRYLTIFVGFLVYLGGYMWWVVLVKYILDGEKSGHEIPTMCSPINHTTRNTSHAEYGAELPVLFNFQYTKNLTKINGTSTSISQGIPSWTKEVCSWPALLIVCLIGLGSGIVRGNLAPYGARHWTDFRVHYGVTAAPTHGQEVLGFRPQRDGSRRDHQKESTMVREFFSWYFMLSNAGSLFAIGALSYIQLTVDYMYGAALGAIGCLGLAFILFTAGGLFYGPRQTTSRQPFLDCVNACCRCCYRRRDGYQSFVDGGDGHETIATHSSASSQSAREQVASEQNEQERQRLQQQQEDKQKKTDNRRFWYLAVISLVLIPYWTINHQMLTTFPFQAVHMNLFINEEFMLPVTWMYLWEAIVIFFATPVIYFCVLPAMEANGKQISMRKRMVIGIVFAILSILAAGVLEIHRRYRYWQPDGAIVITIHNNSFHAANMSVLFQVPQYVLMGMGDAFSNVAGLELIYSQTPETMRGIALGFFWLFSGTGSFISCVLSVIGYRHWFFDWDDGDPNCHECRVEYFFFTQAGLAFVGLVLFGIFTKKCRIGFSYKYDDDSLGDGDGLGQNSGQSIF